VSPDCSDWLIEIGVIGRPHGVRGEMRIFLFNAESDFFSYATSFTLRQAGEQKICTLKSVRPSNDGYLVTLEGVHSKEDALKLCRAKILVNRKELPQPKLGEYYVADLLELKVWDGEELLGHVTSSREQGGIEIIAVLGNEFEIEIPLVEEYIKELHIESGRILTQNTADLPRRTIRKRSK
jgi:16S rRNA processing protein RimM